MRTETDAPPIPTNNHFKEMVAVAYKLDRYIVEVEAHSSQCTTCMCVEVIVRQWTQGQKARKEMHAVRSLVASLRTHACIHVCSVMKMTILGRNWGPRRSMDHYQYNDTCI